MAVDPVRAVGPLPRDPILRRALEVSPTDSFFVPFPPALARWQTTSPTDYTKFLAGSQYREGGLGGDAVARDRALHERRRDVSPRAVLRQAQVDRVVLLAEMVVLDKLVDGGGGARTEQLPLGPKHMEKSTPLEAMKSSTSSVVEPPKWAVDR